MKKIVLDSSVINKLFLNEMDREKAIDLMQKVSADEIFALAPSLLVYEVFNVLICSKASTEKTQEIMEILYLQIDTNIHILEPSLLHLNKAMEISRSGHKKSGYPSLYDSIFHAMAIIEDAVFVTADSKHFAKARSFGHIELLTDYNY
jgi:predicted nucleic acid-binding protein